MTTGQNAIEPDDTGPDGSGWWKCHRKIKRSRVFQDAELLRLFIWLMGEVVHQPQWVTAQVQLKPGQMIFGRHAAAHELRTAPSTTYDRLRRLAEFGMVVIESGNSFSVVTIVNWQAYQGSTLLDPAANPTTRRHPADNAPSHKKNVKNVKNDKKSGAQSPPDGFLEWWAAYPRRIAKLAAVKAYAAAIVRISEERHVTADQAVIDLLAATQQYAASVREDDPKFLPYPASWLNAGRYDDDPQSRNQNNERTGKPASDSPARIRSGEYSNPETFRSSSAAAS